MKVSDFHYELPLERIAQEPCRPRDAARLLVHERAKDHCEHRWVRDLPELLTPGDLLVMNDTRVLPARLHGRRASGGAVEVLLTEAVDAEVWRAMVNPARKLRPDERVLIEGGELRVRALERPLAPDGRPGLEWIVALEAVDPAADVATLLDRCGEMPLPPYVERADEDPRRARDREDYQTVYARERGAVAAPTAGLHLTDALLTRLRAGGVETAFVTLHVGIGTFRPVKVEDTAEHVMHSERYTLLPETCDAIGRTRARGGRVVAVGTTSVRVLESCAGVDGRLEPGSGETSIFITPGYRFRVVDGLMTNYHLPESTLLMLVSALAGRERVLELYAEALREGYRFYSYGDAMLIL